jgi:hypothetical protein
MMFRVEKTPMIPMMSQFMEALKVTSYQKSSSVKGKAYTILTVKDKNIAVSMREKRAKHMANKSQDYSTNEEMVEDIGKKRQASEMEVSLGRE